MAAYAPVCRRCKSGIVQQNCSGPKQLVKNDAVAAVCCEIGGIRSMDGPRGAGVGRGVLKSCQGEEGACRVGAGFLILHVYVRRYVIVSEGIRSVTLAVCCWLLD